MFDKLRSRLKFESRDVILVLVSFAFILSIIFLGSHGNVAMVVYSLENIVSVAMMVYAAFILTVGALLYVIADRCERKARYVTFWVTTGTIGGTLSWMAMGVFLSVIVAGWSAAIAPLVLPAVIMMAAAAALIGLYFMFCWRTRRQ